MNKLKNKVFNLARSKTLQNISKMMTGTMLGQIISTIMVPIASRLYGAGLYGDLAVFTSASSMCTSFLGFGLVSAIMVEETDEQAEQTYKLAVYGTNFGVVIIAGILLLLQGWIEVIHTALPYTVSVCMVAFTVMTTNQINMLYAWLNRKGRYNVLLFNPIITPLVNNALVIGLGVLGFKHIGLYAGLLVSQLVTLIHMFRNMDKMTHKFRLSDAKEVAVRNKDFILFQYPSSFVNGIVSNLPVQIISKFFGNTVVGYYSMSMKLLNIPSGLIGNSVARVYFKEVSDKYRNGESARKYTLKVSTTAMMIFLIPVVGIFLLGDWLIPLVLGASWEPSILYIKIMAIWNLLSLPVNCTTGFTSVIHKQKSNMVLALVKLATFPTFMVGLSVVFNNPIVTIITYVIIYSLINLVYYEMLIGEEADLKWKYTLRNVGAFLICILVAIAMKGIGLLV